jgi:hypothetical protein
MQQHLLHTLPAEAVQVVCALHAAGGTDEAVPMHALRQHWRQLWQR